MDVFVFEPTVVGKTNVTLLQSSLSPHSMLINERLSQQETEFYTKESTIATLQHWIGGKENNGNIKVDFLELQ